MYVFSSILRSSLRSSLCRTKPEPDWAAIIPPPPRLHRRSEPRKDRVPLRVFGFPITYNDKLAWADRFNIRPGDREHIRTQLAWRQICRLLAPERHRADAIYYRKGNNLIATCIIIGTNKSRADLALTQDINVISEVWKIVQVDA